MQGALSTLQNWAPVAVIVGGYLIGLYFQSRSIAHLDTRISDLRADVCRQISDLRADVGRQISDQRADVGRQISDLRADVGQRIDDQGAHVGQRIDDQGAHVGLRIDDLRSYVDKGLENVGKNIADMADVLRAEMAKNHSELLTKFAEVDSRIDRLEQQRWKP